MFSIKVDHEIELQLLQIHDSVELFQLVDHNRGHLRTWLPWVDNITSPHQYHNIISSWLKQYYNNNGFQVGIRYRNNLAGVIGLHSIDWHNKQTSIGYYLGKEFEGNGIMIKSVHALLNYLFFQMQLHRVEIRCGKQNKRSRAIPERLGFIKEGLIRDGEFLYDHYHDLNVYGMLAHDWIKKQRHY